MAGYCLNTKKIVISGITSSLGLSLARMLHQKGFQVCGFARTVEKARSLLPESIELKSMDLLDHESLNCLVEGTDSVIHLAALSSLWGKEEDFYRVNVEGTKKMVDAFRLGKARRFVHVSTPSLYFDFKDQIDIPEEAFSNRFVNYYVKTKKMAEEIVDKAELNCLTIRPRAIFGPHDRSLLPRVLKTCSEKGIPQFRKQNPVIDVTYVDNVAHAICLCLEAPDSLAGQKYNITNGEPTNLWDLLSILLQKLSLPTRFWKIPYPLAYAGAALAEWNGRLKNKEPVLTRYGVGVMTFSQTLSIKKAVQELGYAPIVSLQEGIDRYVEWYQTT